MKRYAWIEPNFNQLLFNETWNWIERIKDKVFWVEQKIDEEKTIKAVEKKYGIKMKWREIEDEQGHKWFGYVKEGI